MTDLFSIHGNKQTPKVRLVCFPYAGGNSSSYQRLAKSLPSWVQLVTLDLPGRGSKAHQLAYTDAEKLVADMLDFYPNNAECPVIFYGHSLGARLAYALASRLYDREAILPDMLIVGASRAPHLSVLHQHYASLDDDAFIARVRQLGDPSSTLLDDPQIRNIYLPMLRADFTLVDSFQNQILSALPIQGIAISAEADVAVSSEQSQGWELYFEQFTHYSLANADHLFVDLQLNTLSEILRAQCRLLVRSKRRVSG
ncbi:hypothetical protein PCIT_a1845 [Pseudoalteromonas citrea]|uniref:Thioesterase domain-containing protein n=2 Tax=Pseudoalteromonas citrea TaxID=43655 RepID=A0AAD4AIV4_9GAMM|nr:alpha/beta fold hydrolase [Pseudoalteromonas citrea]KAF7771887.1 hypothetical protein PCIT_a1845 [Pseudoalteromonas citrea]